MRKIYVWGAALLAVIGVAAFVTVNHNTGSAKPSTVAQAKSRAAAVQPCLTEKKGLQFAGSDRDGIELAATMQLIDVPAGTVTAVHVAAYDQTTAAGAELYPKNYGTYNFTAKKVSTAPGNHVTWEITSFTACKS